jgi:hypothetical protein
MYSKYREKPVRMSFRGVNNEESILRKKLCSYSIIPYGKTTVRNSDFI